MSVSRLGWRGAAAVACTAAACALAITTTMAFADDGPHSARLHQRADASITVDGFDRPESVLHDEKHDVYLVSNITNGPRDRDNTGFISRVAPDGTMLALKWIEGGRNGVTLNAPKGSAIAKGKLYVADIDHIRVFDLDSGDPVTSVAVPGATFLNDVTSDHQGNVFVTDIGFTTEPEFGPSGTDAIWQLDRAGLPTLVAAGNSLLNHPNGIVALDNGLLMVVTYDPFNGTKQLFTIDRRDGSKHVVATLPTGLLDGIVLVPGGVLVSSWVDFSNDSAGVIYRLGNDGSLETVASGLRNPSDIGFDRKRNRMLIPALPDPGDGGQVFIQTLTKR